MTLVSDRGVKHYAFRCEDHDVFGMTRCGLCGYALKSLYDLREYRRNRQTFSAELIAAFHEGWSNYAV